DLVEEGSLPRAWISRWAAAPGEPVLRDADTGWLTAAELEARTAEAAARLAGAGVEPGDRVLMSCPPSADLVIAHVGALRLGAIVVPVNTAFGPNELANVWSEARPALAVLDDPARLPQAPSRRVSLDGPRASVPALDQCGPDDPAMLMFTSGTTGRPKGAILTHGSALASAQGVRIAWRWTPEDRLVLTLPLFHMHGLGVGVHGTLLTGASMAIAPFSVDGALDLASAERATLFFGVPTMYVRFATSPRVGELAALRLCVSGSAALAADVWRVLAELGGQRVIERYGMTETFMNTSNPHDGDRRPGSVGFPLPGVELRLGDNDEICVRGPNVLRAYWERPDATADAFRDTWFLTGDIGEFDDDGYLRIVGRSKDLIITGGFNVYPREIEELLAEHPAVAEAAVAGEPSDEWGETVVAYVVAADTVTESELLEWCGERLAKYKRPRHVRFLDTLPRNALGKVVKSELKP
ncbi:MAG TPA: AMP-binding protein, partial [Acidimicrobiales bacterium]|nr:AMP-binding protein [Acidimicrobiales bacterium]